MIEDRDPKLPHLEILGPVDYITLVASVDRDDCVEEDEHGPQRILQACQVNVHEEIGTSLQREFVRRALLEALAQVKIAGVEIALDDTWEEVGAQEGMEVTVKVVTLFSVCEYVHHGSAAMLSVASLGRGAPCDLWHVICGPV